ncbi:sugar ABC transporter permease [Paenibacillus thalictri]|uniref:Sugar ABC transporter permease n=2 Tax=Paenibacillus thalictri TaxID=2527873 RepID=A0A4Q9DJ24_9BACL|nr:sugar ABC transporter permease [Paenibacillus thalictri]
MGNSQHRKGGKQIRLSQKRMDTLAGWSFILPSILGFSTLTVIPILLSLVISFTSWNFLDGLGGMKFIGFDNFKQLISDKWFKDSLTNNLLFVAGTVPATIVLSLLTAIAINKGVFLKAPIRLMIFMPYVSSIVAVSIVWGTLYNPSTGPINSFLRSIGIADPPGWLSASSWALPAIMIMTVWANIGYNMIIYLAGLQGISQDLYEAAKIDGAGPVTSFFNITVPLLSPTTFFVLITSIIHSFQVFIAVFVMTKGGPGSSTTVLTYYAYRTGFDFYKMGYSSAMAWILFLIIFVITYLQWQGQKRWVHY